MADIDGTVLFPIRLPLPIDDGHEVMKGRLPDPLVSIVTGIGGTAHINYCRVAILENNKTANAVVIMAFFVLATLGREKQALCGSFLIA